MPFNAPAAFAFTHFSGSLSRRMMNAHRTAGAAPIRKSVCQAFSPNGRRCRAASRPMPMPMRPAAMLPQVDSDWSKPSAGGRV